MANIALAVAPGLKIFPFVIPPGTIQPLTAIPRARMSFQVRDFTITAKIATNTTSLVATCELPPNYVYTFEYASQNIVCLTDPADAGNFDDIVDIALSFADGLGQRRSEMFSNGITGHTANAGSIKIWGPINTFPSPIFNQEGGNPAIIFTSNDTDAANTVEGDYSLVCSFLQYDFEQAFNYPMNFPLPVSQR